MVLDFTNIDKWKKKTDRYDDLYNKKFMEIKVNGEIYGYYGKLIPKTAQEIIDQVEIK